jgi:hypothetical protein
VVPGVVPGTVVEPVGVVVVEEAPGSVVVVSAGRVVVVVSTTVVVVDWGGTVVVVDSEPVVVEVVESPGVGEGVVVGVVLAGGATGSGNRVSMVTGAQVPAALASGADDPNPTQPKPRPSAIATRAPIRRSIPARLPNPDHVGNLAGFHYVANA